MRYLNLINKIFSLALIFILCFSLFSSPCYASSQSNSITLPSNYGKLTSNVWRTTIGKVSGNSIQWNYQVSSVYSGSKKVSTIKATWKGSASLRNGANFSIGIGADSIKVGIGSTWRTISQSGCWVNTNGAKSASYRSNIIVTPKRDYRSGTICVQNTAYLKLKGDSRNWSYTASV